MVKPINSKRIHKSVKVQDVKNLRKPVKEPSKLQNKKKMFDVTLRHKFIKHKIKQKSIDISLMRKFDQLKDLPYSYTNDMIGSWFYDELEMQNMCQTGHKFRDFYNEIVDYSQSLALIQNNKQKILTHLLSYLHDTFFQNFLPKLLIAFIRDCGSEIYEEFRDQVFIEIVKQIDVTKIDLLQELFMIFAAVLKFLLKNVIEDFEQFVRVFIGNLLEKKNESIRRFSTEVLMYIIKKIRNKEEAKQKFYIIFEMEFRDELNLTRKALKEQINIKQEPEDDAEDDEDQLEEEPEVEPEIEEPEIEDAEIEDAEIDGCKEQDDAMDEEIIDGKAEAEEFWSYEKIIEDFRACMLFEILKGHAGALSPQMVDLVEPLVSQISESDSLGQAQIKSMNMFQDHESQFFYNYNKSPDSKPSGFYLEDFLARFNTVSVSKFAEKSEKMISYNALQLFNIFIYRKGHRITKPIKTLMETVVSQQNLVKEKHNLIRLSSIYIKKFGFTSHTFDQLENLSTKKEFLIFLEQLLLDISEDRLTIWTRKSLAKKHKDGDDEGIKFCFEEKMYNYFQKKVLNYLQDLSSFDHNDDDEIMKKILLIFSFVHENTKPGMVVSLPDKISKIITKELKRLFTAHNNVSSKNYLQILTIVRICRIFQVSLDDLTIKQIERFLGKLCDSFIAKFSKNGKFCLESLEGSLMSEHAYNFEMILSSYKLNEPIADFYENDKDYNLAVIGELCLYVTKIDSINFIKQILSNLENLITNYQENQILLRTYHRVYTVLSKKLESSDTIDKQQVSILLQSSYDKLQPIFIKNLSSKASPVRSILLSIQDLTKICFHDNKKAELFGYMRRLEAIKANLENERDISLTFTNSRTKVLANEFEKSELKIFLYYLLGYSYTRLLTIQANLQELIAAILYKQPSLVYILFNSYIIKNLICLHDGYLDQNSEENEEIPEKEEEDLSSIGLDYNQMLLKYYGDDNDPIEEESYLMRLLETIKNMFIKYKELNKSLSPKGGRKQKGEKQNSFYQYAIYGIFLNFLQNEVQPTLLLNLQSVLPQQQSSNSKLSENTDFKHNLIEFIKEHELNKLFHGKKVFMIKKLDNLLQILAIVPNITTQEYSHPLNPILKEILKSPYTNIQESSIACFLAYNAKNEIIKKHSDYLKKLVSPKTMKDCILNLNIELKDYSEMEREEIVPIVISILLQKMYESKGTKNKKQLDIKRTIISDFLISFKEDELQLLLKFLFNDIGIFIPDERFLSVENIYEEFLLGNRKFWNVHPGRVSAFLKILKSMITNLGGNLLKFLPILVELVAGLTKYAFYVNDILKEDKTRIKEFVEFNKGSEAKLDVNDKCVLRILSITKVLKHESLERICDFYSNYYEYDFDSVTRELLKVSENRVSNLGKESSLKLSSLMKLFCIWSECEFYKKYFVHYKYVLPNILETQKLEKVKPHIIRSVFNIVSNLEHFDVDASLIRKYNFGEVIRENIEYCQLEKIESLEQSSINTEADKAYLIDKKTETRVSLLGIYVIHNHVQDILTAMQVYMNNSLNGVFDKVKKNPKASNKSASKLGSKTKQKLGNDVQNVCLMVSKYIDNECEDIVEGFLEFVSSFLTPSYINKTTDKLNREIKGAEDMIKFDKELEQKSLLLNLLSSLLKNCSQIEKHYNEIFIPLLVSLRNPRLRKDLSEMLISLSKNKNYEVLNIKSHVVHRLAKLHIGKRGLSEKVYDFDKILDEINQFNEVSINEWNEEEKILFWSHCLFWVGEEELSIRMASQEALELFLMSLASKQPFINFSMREVEFLKNCYITQLMNYMKCHHGSEYIIKSGVLLARKYIRIFINKIDSVSLPSENDKGKSGYQLHDQAILFNNDNEQDFFEQIFNLKIDKRGRAVNILAKMVKDANIDEKKFCYSTINSFLYPIMEYFIFNYWKEITSGSSNSTNTKINVIRTIVNNTIDVYSNLTRYFTFSQYLNQLKEKIAKLKSQPYNEATIVKMLSSILNKIDPNLPDIVKLANLELKKIHENYHQSSFLSTLKNVYNDPESNKLKDARNEVNVIFDLQKKPIETLDKEDQADQANQEAKDAQASITENFNEKKEDFEALQNSGINANHIRILRYKILAPLRKHMHDHGEEGSEKKVRVHVAISIVKLIRVQPLDIFKNEFIRVVNNICVSLKARDSEIRDSARKALLEIAQTTGPFFLHFIFQELKFHLDKGFMLHVRNYTIWYLLKNMISASDHMMNEAIQNEDEAEQTVQQQQQNNVLYIENGNQDYCQDLQIPMLVEEVIGKIEEEKNVAEVKNKSIEFKSKHGQDCFSLIAMKINFQSDSLQNIYNIIEEHLNESKNITKAVNKSTELFKYIIEGLMKNPSIDTENMFLLTFAMNKKAIDLLSIEDSNKVNNELMPIEEFDKSELRRNNLEKTYKLQEGAASGKSIFKILSEKKLSKENLIGKVLANFTMMLFQRCLKKKVLDISFVDKEAKNQASEKFEPLIDQFLKLLNSDYNELVMVSLNIISQVINFPIFAIRKNNKRILKALLRILKTVQASDQQLIQVCFKMIRKLIKTNRFNLGDSHITAVFGLIKEYLYPADWVTEPLNCLETLIKVKMVKSDIYELIDKTFEVMLVSMDPGIISSSKRCILQFIENFPLSDDLYEKYFMRLIRNIDFPEESGRKTILSIIELLVRKLPDEIQQKFIDLYFFSQVTRYVNEVSPKIKFKINMALEVLLVRMTTTSQENEESVMITNQEGNKINQFIKNGLVWIKNYDLGTKTAGFYSLTIIWKQLKNLANQKLLNEDVLEVLQADFDEITSDIEEFYIQVKQNSELKEKMQESAWSSVLADFEDSNASISGLKKKEHIIQAELDFIIEFIKNTNQNTLDLQKKAINLLIQLKKHPNDEILIQLLELLKSLCCSEFLDNKGKVLGQEVLALLGKDILMFVFALIKKKFLTKDLIGEQLSTCLLGFANSMKDKKNSLLGMVSEGQKQITIKASAKIERSLEIIAKILMIIEKIFDDVSEDDQIGKEQEIWLIPVFSLFARLRENGNVKKVDYLYNQLEQVTIYSYKKKGYRKSTTKM